MLVLALALASLSIESPSRDTLFALPPSEAAAAGAAVAGGGAVVVAVAGGALTFVNPAFILLPIVASALLPVACGFGAVYGGNLSESAVEVGVATGAAVVAGGAVGAGLGFIVGRLVDDGSGGGVILAVWASAVVVGVAGGAVGAGLTTSFSE